jgi:serine/threonine protein phosphatase PrpC
MSFISKLLRKTEPLKPATGGTAPLADSAMPAAIGELPEHVVEAQANGAADAAPVESEAGAAADDRESAAPLADTAGEASDSAWWQETPTVPAHAEQAADTHPPESQMAADKTAAVSGTQPLVPAQEQAADAAAPIGAVDEEEGGTRPLTAADVPMLAALRSHRGLAAGALRDVGRIRSVNQDSVFALITTLPRESGDITTGLFIVADGMGGHHGGEVASRLAISTVAHYVLSELVVPALNDGATEAIQPMIVGAVQEANRTIWDHAQGIGSDMGTTCTVALLLGRALYIGHVGDSRAYLATPTGLKLITSDHSTVGRLIQLGQLDPSEAREHPLRSQLYRTVGQQPEVAVDFIYQPLGDATHLLMGSDGLWGMLGDDVLLDVLEHTIWPQDACHELIARANLAGGEDNITAIVVTLPTQL